MCVRAHGSSHWGIETEPSDIQASAFVQNCEVKSQISMLKQKAQQVYPKHPPANGKPAFPNGVPHGGAGRTDALSPGDTGGGPPGSTGAAGDGGRGPFPCRTSRVTGTFPQAMTLAKEIRDRERGGRTYVAVVDGENEKESPKLMEIMNHVLGKRGTLKAAVPDDVVEPAVKAALKLYQ